MVRRASLLLYTLSILSICLIIIGVDSFLIDILLVFSVIWDAKIPETLTGKSYRVMTGFTSVIGTLTFIITTTLWTAFFSNPSTDTSTILMTLGTLLIAIMLSIFVIAPIMAVIQSHSKAISTGDFLLDFITRIQQKHFSSTKGRTLDRILLYKENSKTYYYLFSWFLMVFILDLGVAIGIFNFILGVVFFVSVGVLVITMARDVLVYYRENISGIDLPLEETFILARRDFNFYIQAIADITVYMISLSQIGSLLLYIDTYGFNLLVFIWLVNFIILILIMLEHSYFLTKILPTRVYDHRGHPFVFVTLGLMILITDLWNYPMSFVFLYPVWIGIWGFLLSITAFNLFSTHKSGEFSFLLWAPIALFYSLSLLSYVHILQSLYLTFLLSITMTIQFALLLTNHLTEYPFNMLNIAVMGGLLCIVIAIIPLDLIVKVSFILVISFLCTVLIHNMSWRRFNHEHLSHITSRKILYHLSISSEPCTMKDLKAIGDIDEYDVEPTVDLLVSSGILKITPKGKTRLYSIRSKVFNQKVRELASSSGHP